MRGATWVAGRMVILSLMGGAPQAWARPSDRLFQGMAQGAVAGFCNLVLVRCLNAREYAREYQDAQEALVRDGAALARDGVTSGMTAWACLSARSQRPIILVQDSELIWCWPESVEAFERAFIKEGVSEPQEELK